MCHTGGQKADAGQLFALNDFSCALTDLEVQVFADLFQFVACFSKPLGHSVHGLPEFVQFVTRPQFDVMVEFSACHQSAAFQ